MSGEQALVHLAQSTAEAVAGVLRALGVEDVTTGPTTVAASAAQALQALPTPGVAANVAYVDGVTGGNVFGLSTAGARLLAAATMGGGEPQPDAELSEVELAAVSDAITKMMAAAAAATSAVLATAIEIGVPEIRTIALHAEAAEAFDDPAAQATVTALTLAGEPCRLVQLVPTAFVIRMTTALDDLGAEIAALPSERSGEEAGSIGASLRRSHLRVWAEVGRAQLPAGRVVGLPSGALVELDRGAEDPVDVYVNGLRFATGRLVVDEAGEWAVRLEAILAGAADRIHESTSPAGTPDGSTPAASR
jgi:flagellar motor switch protein FliN